MEEISGYEENKLIVKRKFDLLNGQSWLIKDPSLWKPLKVWEVMDYSLDSIIGSNKPLTIPQIKLIYYQILLAAKKDFDVSRQFYTLTAQKIFVNKNGFVAINCDRKSNESRPIGEILGDMLLNRKMITLAEQWDMLIGSPKPNDANYDAAGK